MKNQEPINTFPIQNFITQVKNAENSKSKEVKLTIEQAKSLAFCLGIVMSRLTEDLEQILANNTKNNDEVIEIQIGKDNVW